MKTAWTATWLAIAALSAGLAPASHAHSVKDLEDKFTKKEQYFQPVDRPAPRFELRDTNGNPVALNDLRGKVVVLYFIYASCPDVCPLHTSYLADVQEKVAQSPMKDAVRFVSITTDPANDTPDVMREYLKAHGIDRTNWQFLTIMETQPEDATRKLAEEFGHTFTKDADGYQVHGVVTHVIDKQGRWRGNFHGLKFGRVNLVLFINALVNESPSKHDHGNAGTWAPVKKVFQ